MTAFLTVKLLEFNQPWNLPWLTPSLIKDELAIQAAKRDRVKVFMDSISPRNVDMEER